MDESTNDLKEKRIVISNRYHLTLGVFVAIVIWCIFATYEVVQHFIVKPMNNKIKLIETDISNTKLEGAALTNKLHDLKQAYSVLLRDTQHPKLIFPDNGASLIGDRIKFKWDYKKHEPYQRYVLELRNIDRPEGSTYKYNILNPEKKIFILPVGNLPYGEYIWRIKPGFLLNGDEISQGLGSQYNSFFIYNTVIDRIKSTERIMVGTSPTLMGTFNYVNGNGNIQGFDVDLINWITEKLCNKLGMVKLKIEFHDIPWSQLLPTLERRDVDLVISAMTKTKYREKNGIKFTDGYYQTHQMFIRSDSRDGYPKDLKGKIVGVISGTTNYEAAVFLSSKYGFQIDGSFQNYADIVLALLNREIDFGLIDDVFAHYDLGMKYHQFGPYLDEELAQLYKAKFGVKSEKYAIALFNDLNKKNSLLSLVNNILASPEGQRKITELKNLYLSK
jgi:polar amino acid transport system substrate-binding protein